MHGAIIHVIGDKETGTNLSDQWSFAGRWFQPSTLNISDHIQGWGNVE